MKEEEKRQTMQEVDLVVIGAGLYGITTTATYHALHPTHTILLLDSSPSIGGPWAPHRTFPGLKTNNLHGTYMYPDYPMDEARFGVKKAEHVAAEKMYEYLSALVEESGVAGCVWLRTRVEEVERVEGGWIVRCLRGKDVGKEGGENGDGEVVVIKTKKLIVSVGLTSEPKMPKYPISTNFTPRVIHSVDFPRNFSDIVAPGRHTLVIGAGKSAWDIVYACSAVDPSSTATMLIRPSGNGPVWMSPSHVTPFRLWLEKLVFTRFVGYMSPCPWAEMSGFEGIARQFLHKTWIGRKIVGAFWQILGDDVVELNKLNEHQETRKLRPWRGAFEAGNDLSILNYPTNFFDLVREGRIRIMIDEVEKLGNDNQVILKSGKTLQVDAVVCATGWTNGSNFPFKPSSLEKELGLPTQHPPDAQEAKLIKRVETDILTQYPFLQTRDTSRIHHPHPSLRYTPTTDPTPQPYRLYRFIVPPSDLQHRSIGFAGALMSLGNATCAYLQALWLTAYLDGTLTLPASEEEVKYETYRDTQYCVLRGANGHGSRFPDLVFDSLPYFDALMRDLGFEGKRKGRVFGGKNWVAESFRSYGPEDYRGLVEEWREKMGRTTGEGKKNV